MMLQYISLLLKQDIVELKPMMEYWSNLTHFLQSKQEWIIVFPGIAFE